MLPQLQSFNVIQPLFKSAFGPCSGGLVQAEAKYILRFYRSVFYPKPIDSRLTGIPVRCKTLEAIFRCTKEKSDRDVNGRRPYMPTELLERSDVLTLRGSMLSDRGTKFAIDLLMVARRRILVPSIGKLKRPALSKHGQVS